MGSGALQGKRTVVTGGSSGIGVATRVAGYEDFIDDALAELETP